MRAASEIHNIRSAITGPAMTPLPTRRYDLDWLRIIAFGLLIFYHIAVSYTHLTLPTKA